MGEPDLFINIAGLGPVAPVATSRAPVGAEDGLRRKGRAAGRPSARRARGAAPAPAAPPATGAPGPSARRARGAAPSPAAPDAPAVAVAAKRLPRGKRRGLSAKAKAAQAPAPAEQEARKRPRASAPEPEPAKRQRTSEGSAPGRGKRGGGEVFGKRPMQKLPIHETLKRQLQFLGFERCTPIQSMAVPAALEAAAEKGSKKATRRMKAATAAGLPQQRRDVMLRAPTGSGKTLAFLIPVLHRILELGCKREDGTFAIILSPTKELALQTTKVAEDLVRMVPNVVCTAVAGGEKPKSEKARLRKGATVLCATPGRLAYHLEQTATFKTSNLCCIVLDEADRLLDMGFERQVRQIYDKLANRGAAEDDIPGLPSGPQQRPQTLLVSATLSPGVKRLAGFCLSQDAYWADPEAAGVAGAPEDADEGIGYAVPKSLTQWYVEVPLRERLPALVAAIASRAHGARAARGEEAEVDGEEKKAIVFFSSCASVDFHHDLFTEAEWPTRAGVRRRQDDGVDDKRRRLKGGFIGMKGDGDVEGSEESDDADDDEDEEEERDSASGAQPWSVDTRPKAGKIMAKTPLFKLHGNLTKEERAGYIADFSRASGGALLASDAASRGLDFPRIDWIIQYDPPQRTEEYLHRVGRTARIGRAGNALLFLSPSEMGFLDHLRAKGLTNIKKLDTAGLHRDLMLAGAPLDLQRARDSPSLLSACFKNVVETNEPLTRLARSAFLSATKSYRAFPRELRPYFPFEDLHPGHFASSFGLRETPRGIAQAERVAAGVEPSGRGRGRGRRGKGGGRGAQAENGSGRDRGRGRGAGASPQRPVDRRQMGQADEFAS